MRRPSAAASGCSQLLVQPGETVLTSGRWRGHRATVYLASAWNDLMALLI